MAMVTALVIKTKVLVPMVITTVIKTKDSCKW
jgi:hypothetical protein